MSSFIQTSNQHVGTPDEFSGTNKKLKVQIGYDTDIGGSTVNQDRLVVITLPEQEVSVIAVADGHGYETGHFVAEITKNSLEKLIKNRIADLLKDPLAFLEFCCDFLHEEIRKGLVEIMEKHGNKVKVDEDGVISKRKHERQPWCVVKGGTTFSIVILIKNKLYIANLGDSTGLLCAKNPVLKPSNIRHEKDVATQSKNRDSESVDDDVSSTHIEITSDHSVENVDEYIRIRDFKCSDDDPNKAELSFIYDRQNCPNKTMCEPVFDISSSGVPTRREDVNPFKYYYKNVRKEKASYVTDKFGQNYLAVTRVLGDFKLQTFGVTNKPVIRTIDLTPTFEENTRVDTSQCNDEERKTVCVVLCSDGVWDNWIYDHVCKFVMDPSCLNAIVTDPENGAKRVTKSFMDRNKMFADRNFGKSSDNATAIVMYITQE